MQALMNVSGLVFTLIGVILLFRYGIPFRASARGDMITAPATPENRKIGRRYTFLGYIGLFLIVAGTALQIVPNAPDAWAYIASEF